MWPNLSISDRVAWWFALSPHISDVLCSCLGPGPSSVEFACSPYIAQSYECICLCCLQRFLPFGQCMLGLTSATLWTWTKVSRCTNGQRPFWYTHTHKMTISVLLAFVCYLRLISKDVDLNSAPYSRLQSRQGMFLSIFISLPRAPNVDLNVISDSLPISDFIIHFKFCTAPQSTAVDKHGKLSL